MPTSMPVSRIFGRLPARSSAISTISSTFAVPVLLRPSAEIAAADETRLVVVGAEVGGARMRHLDRDQRDVRFAVLRRDDRRDVLVGLELDDEIDFLAHEDVGVALRDLRVVAVVDADELDPSAAAARCRPVEISFENW